jgi:hypothetical protein
VSPLARALLDEIVEAFRTNPELRAELRELLGVAVADQLLTIGQAAKESGYSTRTIARKIAAGLLPAVGTHKATRIRRADLVRLLESGGRREVDTPEAIADLEESARLTSPPARDPEKWVPRSRRTR